MLSLQSLLVLDPPAPGRAPPAGAELRGAGHPLPPWGHLPGLCKALFHQAELKTPDLMPWAGKTDSVIATYPCFLLLLVSQDRFAPAATQNSCFVYLAGSGVRKK